MWRWGAVVVAGMLASTAAHTTASRPGSLLFATAPGGETARTKQQFDARFTGALDSLDAAAYTAMVTAHRGHVLIVDFWATWCAPCREEMPGLIAMAGRYPPRDVQLTTVSADMDAQMEEAEQFLDSVRAPRPRYIKRTNDDDRFIQAVDSAWTGALPAVFVYDRQGRRVRAFVGETLADSVAAAVRVALER
jgi:thiol-disulfide isomerase/thioredoxin